jgi:hypothetical protein
LPAARGRNFSPSFSREGSFAAEATGRPSRNQNPFAAEAAEITEAMDKTKAEYQKMKPQGI